MSIFVYNDSHPARFRDWTQKYGSIIGLKFGPANVVILNNYKDVQE